MKDAPIIFNGRIIPKKFEQFKHNDELYEIMGLCFECGGDVWTGKNKRLYCHQCGNKKEHSNEMIAEYLSQGGQEYAQLKKPKRQRVKVI